MSKTTCNLLIKFKDGEELRIDGVEDWGATEDGEYYITRHGRYSYFTHNSVKYIGVAFDLENRQPGYNGGYKV